MSSGTVYYISGRKQKQRSNRNHWKWLIPPTVAFLILLLINLQFSPILSGLAEKEAERKIESLVGTAIADALGDAGATYSDIIKLTYKENGSVASLQADTARLLAFRTVLLKSILDRIAKEAPIEVSVPVASLLGLNFFPSSRAVDVRLRISESVNAYFVSEFEEQGINQTRHSILFCFTLDILVLVPNDTQRITVTRKFPFAETIIVGDVPDAYTKISRLTDDITESEIDDIYDFGAGNN